MSRIAGALGKCAICTVAPHVSYQLFRFARRAETEIFETVESWA